MNGHEAIDHVLRRAAHEALETHHRSVPDADIEAALHTVAPAHRDGRPRRRVVAALAAAAVVALVGALVVVNRSGDPDVVTPATEPIDSVATTAPSTVTDTSTPPTSAAPTTSTPPPVALGPSMAFDMDGDPLPGFDLDHNAAGDRSAFAEILRDYLLHGTDILGDTVAERAEQLDNGGLAIHTTFDVDAQAAADSAQAELPSNSIGIDSAIVSIDNASGAVRAMSGTPTTVDDRQVNMAVRPRQTGSAIGLFIVAAATQAGVQGGDIIDGMRGCRLPSGDPNDPDFEINGGVSGFIGSIQDIVARAVMCGMARLSNIVGLDDIVDTTYDMAASPYFDPVDPALARDPFQPFASLATGANEMSTLDMASGMQTLANEGVHHDPYFVDSIDDADGNRLYTHRPSEQRVLDTAASLEAIDIMKGVLAYGTGRLNAPLDGERPAFGVTGTQFDNTNAWFVGATRELTTAVWVGDPTAYTQMINVAEFGDVGVLRVQGGTFPAAIWKAFNDQALSGTAVADWASPPPPTRPDARLVLPGNECILDPASPDAPQQIEPIEPITTVDLATSTTACDAGR